MVHRTLALGGRAVEPYSDTEGLLPDTGSTLQLILQNLWDAIPVISGSLDTSQVSLLFSGRSWYITMVMVLIVKRQYVLRRVKTLGKRCSALKSVEYVVRILDQ